MKTTITAGVRTRETEEQWTQKMAELQQLCEAAGLIVADTLVQRADQFRPRTLIGSGKCKELRERIEACQADGAVFLNELSGVQIRNLEEALSAEVADRNAVILEIFERNARTRQARLQVQAARLAWQLPRLIQGQIGQDQQQGGGARNRGAGEKKLELNRRTIERQLRDIRRQLDQLKVQHRVQSERRRRSGLKQVCLIGYSNAGKSSLMNALLQRVKRPADKQVLQRDQLFSTLDSSIRQLRMGSSQEYLLSDTVGFVRDLPDFLLEAFESTLQEILDADLLIEVLDASDSQWPIEHEIVTETLKRLKAETLPRIIVYNKIDKVSEWERTDGLAVSCLTGFGLSALEEEIGSRLGMAGNRMRAEFENRSEISGDLSYNESNRGEGK